MRESGMLKIKMNEHLHLPPTMLVQHVTPARILRSVSAEWSYDCETDWGCQGERDREANFLNVAPESLQLKQKLIESCPHLHANLAKM